MANGTLVIRNILVDWLQTMVYGTQITIVTGAFVNQLITEGLHIVGIFFLPNLLGIMIQIMISHRIGNDTIDQPVFDLTCSANNIKQYGM